MKFNFELNSYFYLNRSDGRDVRTPRPSFFLRAIYPVHLENRETNILCARRFVDIPVCLAASAGGMNSFTRKLFCAPVSNRIL